MRVQQRNIGKRKNTIASDRYHMYVDRIKIKIKNTGGIVKLLASKLWEEPRFKYRRKCTTLKSQSRAWSATNKTARSREKCGKSIANPCVSIIVVARCIPHERRHACTRPRTKRQGYCEREDVEHDSVCQHHHYAYYQVHIGQHHGCYVHRSDASLPTKKQGEGVSLSTNCSFLFYAVSLACT